MPFKVTKERGGPQRYSVKCGTCAASAMCDLPGPIWHLETLLPKSLATRLEGERDTAVHPSSSDALMLTRLAESVARDLRTAKCTHAKD